MKNFVAGVRQSVHVCMCVCGGGGCDGWWGHTHCKGTPQGPYSRWRSGDTPPTPPHPTRLTPSPHPTHRGDRSQSSACCGRSCASQPPPPSAPPLHPRPTHHQLSPPGASPPLPRPPHPRCQPSRRGMRWPARHPSPWRCHRPSTGPWAHHRVLNPTPPPPHPGPTPPAPRHRTSLPPTHRELSSSAAYSCASSPGRP